MNERNAKSVAWLHGAALALLALGLNGCATQDPFRPSEKEFTSKWVDIVHGSFIGGTRFDKTDKPKLILAVQNKGDQPLWISTRFEVPRPNQDCTVTIKLVPKEKQTFTCLQESIVAETDYPIHLNIFLDERLTNEAEKNQMKMRFDRRSLDAMQKWSTAPQLPATFKGVNSTKEPGIGTLLFGPFASIFADDSSTLVVRQDSIEYTSKDKTFAIPVTQVRSVNIKKYDREGVRAWVVVEYAEPDGIKVIAFQGNPVRLDMETLQDIERAISYARYVHERKK